MRAVRSLLARHGLPAEPGPFPAGTPADQTWRLRAAGLDRRLDPAEWARVLIHIARHRGFMSNSKRDRDNKSEAGKALQAMAATGAKLAGYRTFGEMLACDPEFARRKRNRTGDYRLTPLRDWLQSEVRKLFEAQRRLGNPAADPAFEATYVERAFFQRPFRKSEDLVGPCRFEPGEKRAPSHAPSFERFRFLAKLNNQKVCPPGSAPRPFSEAERRAALALYATHKRLTYEALRKAIGLGEDTAFEGLPMRGDDPETKDFARFEGSVALRDLLGAERFWSLLRDEPARLDAIAETLIRLDDVGRIRERLADIGLEPETIDRLTGEEGLRAFLGFKGSGHISTAACRKLVPFLERGLVYSEACRAVGYDHAAIGLSRAHEVRNPVVQKVLRECLKQIQVVLAAHGPVDAVHLEMARDVGKSPEERDAIREANERRAAERAKNRSALRELLSLDREPNDEELLRYELWLEQNHRCPYTASTDEDSYICPEWLLATDNRVQVDHILPYSWSADDSFRNKVLVLTSANQEKGRRTPWAWLGGDPARWARFEAHVKSLRSMHPEKRKKLLARGFEEERRRSAYAARNLNDTRYAMRVLRHELEIRFPTLEKRRVFARPGAITAMLRRAWGLDILKKSGELGDRDHALDALVVACTDEALLQRLTRLHQEREELRSGREIVTPPTPLGADPSARERFRQMLKTAAEGVFVSRPETRRGRGAFHDATLYGFDRGPDGSEVQYERKKVWELEPSDLDRLKGDPARSRVLRQVLEDWLALARERGVKPEKLWPDDPPRLPDGPPIRTVVLRRKRAKSGIKLPRGQALAHADLDSMVRVDVFARNGRYYLVPVYAWQVARLDRPPMRAIVAHKEEDQWDVIDDSFVFRFSLYPGSYVIAVNRSGERFEGYYAGADRNGGTLSLRAHHSLGKPARPGVRLLASFEKYHVDRLGRLHRIEREPRLWRGAVCF